MVRIRLKLMGRHGRPFYRIVVIERSRRRDGREIARIGTYDPLTDPITVKVNREQFDLWVKRGAQASDTVRTIVLGEKPKIKRKPKVLSGSKIPSEVEGVEGPRKKSAATETPAAAEAKPEEPKPEKKKETT
ncbi:MAG: 30S ribosomal protein S16 [bacterium]|nr:30S ribosomal protein S16 [bacterium]